MPEKTKKKAPKDSPKKNPAKKAPKEEREVLYPNVEWEPGRGVEALTVDAAKSLLGWQDLPKEAKDYDLQDKYGNKVRLTNNLINRRLYESNYLKLAQEMLNRRWRYNGEPIIIGKYGSVLNGQHTLVGLVIAEQLRYKDTEVQHHWEEHWKLPVTIEKSVVYGIDEDDGVVNTLDTGKSRTLTDVFYRSSFFRDKTGGERQHLAAALAVCVKTLWKRTGLHKNDMWTRFKTHSEMADYVERHTHTLRSVEHIVTEDGEENLIRKWVGTHGEAAALLFLMGSCESDPIDYNQSDPPDEAVLKFDSWDNATEFWTLLKSGKDFKEVRGYLNKMCGDAEKGVEPSPAPERVALIINAWRQYYKGGVRALEPEGPDGYVPKYEVNDDGIHVMSGSPPLCGGIDQEQDDSGTPAVKPPTPEELEAEKKKIKEENQEAMRTGKGKGKKDKAKKAEESEPPAPDPDEDEDEDDEDEDEPTLEDEMEEMPDPEPAVKRKPIKRKGPGDDPEKTARKTRG
jgi:hypothetical protein